MTTGSSESGIMIVFFGSETSGGLGGSGITMGSSGSEAISGEIFLSFFLAFLTSIFYSFATYSTL